MIYVILIAVKTHDDKLYRVVMEVLKDVTRDDLNDEAHDIHIYFKQVGPFPMYNSAIIYILVFCPYKH